MKVPHFRSRFLFYVIRHMSMIALSAQMFKFLLDKRDQLRELLKKGGFYLQKRASNATSVVRS